MKTTTILAVFCLWACGTCYGKQGHARSYFSGLQTRDAAVCELQCNAANGSVSANSSWELDIVIGDNESIVINIGYQASVNVIAIIYQRLNIAVAIDGNNGLVGFFNISSGGSIVANITSGIAVYVHASASVSGLGLSRIDVSAAIVVLAEVITSSASSVGAGANAISGNVYNLGNITSAIYKNSNVVITAEGYYNGRVELQRQIDDDVRVWSNLTRQLVADGALKAEYGIIGLIAPALGQDNELSEGLVQVLVALYASGSGQFSGQLSLAIYNIISVSSSSSSISKTLASLSATINAVGSLYANLDAALSAYLSGNGLVSYTQRTVVIASKTYVISYGRTADGSWFINLKSTADASVDVIIAYVKKANLLVIYNRRLDIILVFSGSSGLFAIWNVKTGEGIIVRYSTGAAIVIKADSSISVSFSASAIFEGVIAIGLKIQEYRSFSFSILNRSTFLFSTYIIALQARGLAAANLAVSSAVSAVINASFRAYFELVAAARAGWSAVFGVLNVIYVATGSIAVGWSTQIQAFIAAIYSSGLAGQFNADLVDEIYVDISVNVTVVGSSSFLSSITSQIKSITKIVGDIGTTITGALTAAGGGSIKIGR